MSERERHILLSPSVSASLPAPLRRGVLPEGSDGATVHLPSDLLAEAARLLDDGQGARQIILFLAPAEVPAVAELARARRVPRHAWAAVVIDAGSRPPAAAPPGASSCRSLVEYRTTPPTAAEVRFLLIRTWETLSEWQSEAEETDRRAAELSSTSADLEALVRIGQALSQVKDQGRLLRTILSTSKRITGADGGSISLVEKDEQGNKRLRFKYSHTFSRELPFEEQVMPYDTRSLGGYVAVTGRVLNLPDAYALDPSLPFSFNPSFDRAFDYRTRSMLVVPMRNHVDEVIGVISLINCKESPNNHAGSQAFEIKLSSPEDYERYVVPFAARYEGLMQAVASQAAIAIENNRMIAQIQGQFEQFVRAAVTAIDSRDPPTSGHSVRVAQMCTNTARAIDAQKQGPFAEVAFSEHALRELELAGLLHDFGKVYLDAGIFLKAKKLFPADLAYLMLRLEYLHRSLELEWTRRGPAAGSSELARKLDALRSIKETIKRLNEPTVLAEDRAAVVRAIRERESELGSTDLAGNPVPLLTDHEATNLTIPWGTLNEQERAVIQSHVMNTYTFVEKIPWPAEYARIPRIARSHHEKLDGSGYPDGLKGKEQIPIEARIMAVADIFDALAASDRPYKKALPLDQALAKLREEAAAGELDVEIVEIFISSRAYDVPRPGGGGDE